jgi:hypothetical protein
MLTTEERVISRFVEAGFSSRVSVNTLDEALSVLALHHSVLVSKAEIDDFCEGLQNLQVLESIRNCKDQFKQLFVADENDKLTAGMMETRSGLLFVSVSLYCRQPSGNVYEEALFRGGHYKPF